MTFSYNLVLALFLFAPGFAAYAGFFAPVRSGQKFYAAPPAPGSITTLAIVTLSALALHAGLAIILQLQLTWAEFGLPTWKVDFEPNIYLVMAPSKAPLSFTSFGIACFFAEIILLTVIGFFAANALAGAKWGQRIWGVALYGWAAGLLAKLEEDDRDYHRWVTAFVLTTLESDGYMFGYEGTMANIYLSPDKEITSISLTNVTAFYVKLGPKSFARKSIPRDQPIPEIFLEKSQISNVAFQVYRSLKADATSP